jgi:hypothetical protein
MVWNGISSVASIFVLRNGSPICFSSAEWFGTEFREATSIFNLRDGIPSCFLFCGRVRNGILRGYFYFFYPRNGIPSCFLFRGRVRNGIPRVPVPRNSRNSVGNNHLFRLFRLPRNNFFVGNSQPYPWGGGGWVFLTWRTFVPDNKGRWVFGLSRQFRR